jgi:hypothetical protein
MIGAFALCLTIATTPGLDGAEVLRGCALVDATQAAAEAYELAPELLLAVGWRETRWRPLVNAGGYCGPFQVLPRWADGATCAQLHSTQGPWAAARILATFAKGRTMAEGLRRYSGSKPGSGWYARQVLAFADSLKPHAEGVDSLRAPR